MLNTCSKIFALGLFSFYLSACDREAKIDSTKISLQLPSNISSLAQIETFDTATMNFSGGVFSEWSAAIPTGLKDFNCYAAMVSGPETFLNRNSCGQKDPVTKVVNYILKFGPIVGTMSAGSSIDLEVLSGESRVITLVGFMAADASACQNINSTSFDKSKLSKPYIIGQSAALSLKPTTGAESVTVPIAMNFKSEQWYDTCSGPEFENSNLLRQATQVELRKVAFPQGALLRDSCTPFEIELKDSANRTATSAISNYLGVFLNDGTSSNSVASYESYLNCKNSITGKFIFSIPPDSPSLIRWIPVASTMPFLNYSLDLRSTTLIPVTNVTNFDMPNRLSSAEKLDLTGPTSVNLESPTAGKNCFKYEIAYRGFDSTYKMSNTGDYISIKVPEGVIVSPVYNCATEIPGSTTDGIIRTYTKQLGPTLLSKVYIQFPNTGVFKFQTERLTGSTHPTDSLPGKITVEVTKTNNIATNLKIFETSVLPRDASHCYGPFHVAQVNGVGAEVPLNNAGNATISIINPATGPSNYTLYSDDGCTSVILNNVTILNLDSSTAFYVKPSSSSSPSEDDLTFILPGLPAYKMKLIIN